MQPHPAALPPAIHRPPGRIFNCLLGVASHARYIGNRSLFIAGGRGAAAAAAEEDLRLNKMKFGRSPLWMLFHWSDPPPMSLFSQQIWVVSPLNPPKVFIDPPFGFSVTTDLPFSSPKYQVAPPAKNPPLPQAINNDRSLTLSHFAFPNPASQTVDLETIWYIPL